MPCYKVSVKWGKEKFSLECDTDEPPMVFKAQLFALSGVQPDRQKVMVKGATIKDEDWGNTKLKDGMTLLMMGSADALPSEPQEKTVFMEDMSDQQLAQALEMPAGLTNLGNTCYMNATLQCLKNVPEIHHALRKFEGGLSMGNSLMASSSVTSAMRDLFESMDKKSDAIPPIIFLQVLHMAFPQFSEKTEQGGFAQQDANECWTELVRCLQQKLPALTPENEEGMPQAEPEGAAATANHGCIDQYMSGEYEVVMKCVESDDEEPVKSTERFYQLSCFIEKEVKYMHTGLQSRLEENITKHSPTLGRDAVYTKSSKLNRLPGNLSIQFVRFFFKEKEAINAKILKDIKFPLSLDVFDLCTTSLQQKLIPAREKFKAHEDKLMEDAIKAGKQKPNLKELAVRKENVKTHPYWFSDDIGSNNSGYYELSAVLTHKGRSSSSGHYVAWTRKKGEEWLMYDDDMVSPVSADDVLKLSGGGDWHCAYVLLYSARLLEVDDEKS